MKRKWMTLLELVIVMAILGILFVLLLRTYNRISTMVFRVQQEKEVAQEILQISQTVQNLADRNAIDYTKYSGVGNTWEEMSLVSTDGITSVLYLSGLDGQVTLYTTGDCLSPSIEYAFTGAWSWCSLFVDVWGKTRELINSKKVLISEVVFKIIPYASEQQYIDTDNLCAGNYLQCLNSPWFRMIFTAYSVNYWTQRATHVRVPFQQFF